MDRHKNAATFKGEPVTFLGTERRVGDTAPDFTLAAGDLSPVTLYESRGKTRVLLTVLSVDTSTCSRELVAFNKLVKELGKDVVVYVISRDLPFAQTRLCGSEGIENIKSISAYKNTKFATDYGILWEGPELLGRTIFIIDGDNKITYKQVVPEMSE
ncbi:MAG TPA: thiol peroxidase, partial [candidate division Zixibacteria bacterium]|nr:thiol peroxidase [candidate division Zixibacteria bacterium]